MLRDRHGNGGPQWRVPSPQPQAQPEQSERVKKLTLMATYFIPLTFTSSLFGMNFDVLGQSDVPVW